MKKSDTDSIERQLQAVSDYDDFLENNGELLTEIHPGSYILSLMEAKALDKKSVVGKVDMNTGYVYEIFRGEKRPERDKMLQFAFALGLGINETQEMLKRCGYALLYGKNSRDSVIIFCISRHKSLIDANIMLHTRGFTVL